MAGYLSISHNVADTDTMVMLDGLANGMDRQMMYGHHLTKIIWTCIIKHGHCCIFILTRPEIHHSMIRTRPTQSVCPPIHSLIIVGPITF